LIRQLTFEGTEQLISVVANGVQPGTKCPTTKKLGQKNKRMEIIFCLRFFCRGAFETESIKAWRKKCLREESEEIPWPSL
jgi:hypothetical protein